MPGLVLGIEDPSFRDGAHKRVYSRLRRAIARLRASSTRHAPDPESRSKLRSGIWIPGSLAYARAPE